MTIRRMFAEAEVLSGRSNQCDVGEVGECTVDGEVRVVAYRNTLATIGNGTSVFVTRIRGTDDYVLVAAEVPS